MIRIVFFLILVGLGAAAAAWVAEQPGLVVLTWGTQRATMSLPVFVMLAALALLAAIIALWLLSVLWRAPGRIRRHHHARRHARGRHAITHGLLAIGHGDQTAARRHADVARRLAGDDPLTLLLHAQAAQLEGDREAARHAFRAMTERQDTRLLGLRGLFIEAQRADDALSAVMIADEALKVAPQATWASQAVLGFRCAQGDWNGALAILDGTYTAGLIDKPAYRRQRGVLLTARGLDLETKNRDLSRSSAMEAVKLAPTLVPAALLAAKFESEAHQVRRAMKIIEAAWVAGPHPELADAYAHVRLGDSARQRLSRVESLAARTPGAVEGALATARAAIDAAEFARARAALAPFTADPTQRVAMLMAELERTEHGDAGRAREWTLRAVHARHDPAWTADGYVSDRWRPVSPVSGRLDAFQWQTPLASLPSDRGRALEPEPADEAALAAPLRPTLTQGLTEPPREITPEPVLVSPTAQDNLPPPKPVDRSVEKPADKPVDSAGDQPLAPPSSPAVAPVSGPPPRAEVTEPAPPLQAAPPEDASPPLPAPVVTTSLSKEPVNPAVPAPAGNDASAPVPLFRPRSDLGKPAEAPIPAIVPIVRPPDDPGIEDDEAPRDEFAEQIAPKEQAGGWRGFLARFGG